MTVRPTGRTIRRAVAALVVVAPLCWLGWKLGTDNFETVDPGVVYRSAQMDARALGRAVRTHGIKTVLNLRGSHPESAWYRQEREATLAQGATQVDVAMSSCEWMSKVQLQAVVHVLDTAEHPILIHCWRGAERTGLVSAFTQLLRPGVSLEDAKAQFSIRYLFLPVGDGAVTRQHLEQYEAWLKRQGAEHTPARFRQWACEGFRPGKPSREDWPYDPYPLVVVTRPEPEALPQETLSRNALETEPFERANRR
jgi:protein tyrosine phosphatase (PTP) superfamily phosphohydrolase (DUF442 family)